MAKHISVTQAISNVAAITGLILLIPYTAQLLTSEVNWTLSDFIFAGTLIFGTGTAYAVISRQSNSIMYRVAAGLTLATAFFLVWINLAVGIIGSEENAGNLMYFGIELILLIGTVAARLKAEHMSLALLVTAVTQALTIPVALFYDMQQLSGSSVMEIIVVNGVFIALFGLAGGLFWQASKIRSEDE